jgi:O-antigen ligase
LVSNRQNIPQHCAVWLTLAAAVAPLISIAASHVLLAASAVSILLARERPRFPPVKLPLALFLAGTVLSLLLSGNVAAGWPQIRKFYVIFLVLFTIATAFRKVNDDLRLILWWAVGATCSACLGLIQFTERFLAMRQAGGNLYEGLVGHRITGFMSLWMTFSGQLMIVLMMLIALLMFSEQGRKHWKSLVACSMLIGLALVLALTRGPWIGAGAGVVYLMWRWNRKSLAALPVVLVLAYFIAPAPLQRRATSIQHPGSYQDSNQHRIVLWRTGLEMVKAHPWFGLGPEQVSRQFLQYVPADIARPLPWGWREHLHNIYLHYAAERGIPVLLMFLWFAGKVLWDFLRAAGAQPAGLGAAKAVLHGSTAAILAVLVAGLFEHNLGDSEMLQMFLSTIAAGYVAAES